MANSRFEYVKHFELDDALLPGCWIVVRLDGKGFTKYASALAMPEHASHNNVQNNHMSLVRMQVHRAPLI